MLKHQDEQEPRGGYRDEIQRKKNNRPPMRRKDENSGQYIRRLGLHGLEYTL